MSVEQQKKAIEFLANEEERQKSILKSILDKWGWHVTDKDLVDFLEIINEFNKIVGRGSVGEKKEAS